MDQSLNADARETIRQRREAIRNLNIAPGSRKVYDAHSSKFIRWLYVNEQRFVTNELLAYIEERIAPNSTNLQTEKIIRQFLEDNRSRVHPIKFDDLPETLFIDFLIDVKKRNGEGIGSSALGTYRSSLKSLYTDYYKTYDDRFETEIARYFSGFKKEQARLATIGEEDIHVGKKPMKFSLYQAVAKDFLSTEGTDHIFAHCFLVTCWNLMCRSSSALSIHYSHMDWSDDALTIKFAQMKNDQTGSLPRDPRHIYANPLMPHICPILALAIYFACFGFDSNGAALFPGIIHLKHPSHLRK